MSTPVLTPRNPMNACTKVFATSVITEVANNILVFEQNTFLHFTLSSDNVVKLEDAFMRTLEALTDEELQAEYRSMHFAIHVVDCFSIRDLVYCEVLSGELERRKILIFHDVSFVNN